MLRFHLAVFSFNVLILRLQSGAAVNAISNMLYKYVKVKMMKFALILQEPTGTNEILGKI